MPNSELIAQAEASIRAYSGLVMDCALAICADDEPDGENAVESFLATSELTAPGLSGSSRTTAQARQSSSAHMLGPRRTHNAVYAYDGTLEGMFTALHAAFCARDGKAEILDSRHVQPRLGQDVYEAPMQLNDASKVRRLIEYSLGDQAFRCIRAVAASDNPTRGTVIYRFVREALATSDLASCNQCERKRTCTRACRTAASCPMLDDLANPVAFDLMSIYREVMNERHKMVQFMRFEHCAGDVWYARCNPKANVVPLLMDWFIPRFNDQKFLIYDENHAMSGVYDGTRWYLVRGDAVTPPPHMDDERMIQEAWRRFYRCLSVEARYNPELRRGFMPMRLWRNLTEMRPG